MRFYLDREKVVGGLFHKPEDELDLIEYKTMNLFPDWTTMKTVNVIPLVVM